MDYSGKTNERKDNNYIFDAESSAEMARLINQDRFITRAMGGPFPGLPALPQEARILDLGCGPGGWVLDSAFATPDAEVAGVDISQSMINYANARARSQGLTNATFGVMDITTYPLDFSNASFDLVNARFLMGVLKHEVWPAFIAECLRLLRPGGILRFSEADTMGETVNPSLAKLNALAMQAIWKAGYGFSADGSSFAMTPGLLLLLKQAGYRDIQAASYVIDYSADSQVWADCYHNLEIIFQHMKSLFIRYDLIEPQEFDLLYGYTMKSMRTDDFFIASGQVNSIWIKKLYKKEDGIHV